MAKINLGRIKLQFQGEYDRDQLYRRDDIVYHSNAMWIMTNEYLADGSSAYAPGSKVQGYNVKEKTGRKIPITTVLTHLTIHNIGQKTKEKLKDKEQIETEILLNIIQLMALTKMEHTKLVITK